MNEARNDVAVLQVIVVVRSINIGRNNCGEFASILLVVSSKICNFIFILFFVILKNIIE